MPRKFDHLNETKDKINYEFKRSLTVNLIILALLLGISVLVPGWGITAGIGFVAAIIYTAVDILRYVYRMRRYNKYTNSFVI